MIKSMLVIGLGGGIGSICRYLLQVAIHKAVSVSFPLGTMVVNILGCFLIGILYGAATRIPQFTLEWRLFLITGICGGFTTFSSFSYEGMSLMLERNYLYFFSYMGLSVFLGLLATWAGLILFK